MTNKIRIFFLIALASFKRKLRRNIIILIFSLGFLLALIKFPPEFLHTNSISEALVGTYEENDLPEVAARLISRGLVKMDQDGRAIPDLASGWEVNNDATTFTFKLSKGLSWTDGTPIIAKDLEFNIPDVEVSYPDDLTIQFKLKDSFSALPSILVKPIFKKNTLLGIGPYKVTHVYKSVVFITKITLEPTDKNLPNLSLRFYPNEKIALTAFSLGEVESILGVSNVSEWKSHPKAKVFQIPSYGKVVAILYNFEDPVLGSKTRSLRQALSYSAPSLKDETEAKSPIPPISWASTAEVNDYLDNYELAKQALGRARSSIKEEDLQKPIVLTVTPTLSSLGQQVKKAWESLGLKVVVRTEPGIPQNFQALLITQTIPEDPDQYSLWHSTQSKTNLTKYSSPRVDKDLEDGRKVTDEEERKNKYIDFQKAILEDSPATFLYFPKYNVVYLTKVEDKVKKVLNLQFHKVI